MKTRSLIVALIVLIAVPAMALDPTFVVGKTETAMTLPLLPAQWGLDKGGLTWKVYASLAKMEDGEIVGFRHF